MEWQERICRIEGRVWMIAHLPLLLGRTVGYVSILCTKKTMPIRVYWLYQAIPDMDYKNNNIEWLYTSK